MLVFLVVVVVVIAAVALREIQKETSVVSSVVKRVEVVENKSAMGRRIREIVS